DRPHAADEILEYSSIAGRKRERRPRIAAPAGGLLILANRRVAIEIPVEQAHPVLGVVETIIRGGDEPVQRHPQGCDHLRHLLRLPFSRCVDCWQLLRPKTTPSISSTWGSVASKDVLGEDRIDRADCLCDTLPHAQGEHLLHGLSVR